MSPLQASAFYSSSQVDNNLRGLTYDKIGNIYLITNSSFNISKITNSGILSNIDTVNLHP